MATTKPNNPTAGSAEPYWFEWKLGLLQLVELLDKDSEICSVALQLHGAKGWDDVGVQFRDGRTRLLQAKHSRMGEGITFGDLVSVNPEGDPSLLGSLAEAWKHEVASRRQVECVFVTNCGAGVNSHGDRPPLEEFLPKLKERVASAAFLCDICWDGEDPRYLKAWELFTAELKALSDPEKIAFLKTLSIEPGSAGLLELEGAIRSRLTVLTGLPASSVNSLFNALLANLRKWTCHSRREWGQSKFTNAMNKQEFKTLFEQALELAARNAETKLGRAVPRAFEIEMHGLAAHPRLLKKDNAFEEIYLGPDRFYRIIDLAVHRVSKDACTVFMRVSGHAPGTLNQTWNQPPGSGPFKQVLADEVKEI